MLFTGIYEHTIDAKHRLAIPSELRDLFDPVQDGKYLYVALRRNEYGNLLCIYTEADFRRRAEDLERSELSPAEVLEYEEVFFGYARPVEMDKQGRVRLPEHLLGMADPGRDVVLSGAKDHLQIHPRQRWMDRLAKRIEQKPELLRNPRELMIRNPERPENG